MASNKSSIVRLPVSVNEEFDVMDVSSNATIASNLRPTRSFYSSSPFGSELVLVFNTGPLEPIGAAVFRVRRTLGSSGIAWGTKSGASEVDSLERIRDLESKVRYRVMPKREIVANNGILSAQFDR